MKSGTLKILDVGSGPDHKLKSDYLEIEVVSCDNRLLKGVDWQDMESLGYPDKSFDIVTCINALDHTPDAEQAIKELLRVGRMVYINCAIDQKTRHRKKHYWDFKPNGEFTNGTETYDLRDWGFEIEFEDGRMVARCYQS